jgi:hypothetical protein
MPLASERNEAIAPREGDSAECSIQRSEARIVHDLNDLLMVFTIRASVYGGGTVLFVC